MGVGGNVYGQLGDGTLTDRLTPVQVLTGVTAASSGAQPMPPAKPTGWTN